MEFNMRGIICLLSAAFVWGTAFVAQSAAADSVSTFTFTAARSFIASLFLFIVILFRKKTGGEKKSDNMTDVRGGIICGLLLFIASNLQQYGIGSYPENAAASGRAGFITATYVVMLALAAIFTGRGIKKSVLAAAGVCIAGMYMLCFSDGIGGVYTGDVIVLLSAAGFALYIMAVDRCAGLDALKVSCVQFLTCGALSSIFMLIFEKPEMNSLLAAWFPIVYVGVMSSGIGYTLQIIGQKYAEPTVAAIVMSLESVFAAAAGCIILGERLSGGELAGCVLVFAAVIIAQLPGLKKYN